jgi:hypothetical protein
MQGRYSLLHKIFFLLIQLNLFLERDAVLVVIRSTDNLIPHLKGVKIYWKYVRNWACTVPSPKQTSYSWKHTFEYNSCNIKYINVKFQLHKPKECCFMTARIQQINFTLAGSIWPTEQCLWSYMLAFQLPKQWPINYKSKWTACLPSFLPQ